MLLIKALGKHKAGLVFVARLKQNEIDVIGYVNLILLLTIFEPTEDHGLLFKVSLTTLRKQG